MRGETFAKVLAWVFAYAAFSWLGLLLRIPPNDIAAFWPAAGIGMAAVYWGLTHGVPRSVAYSIVPIGYLVSAFDGRGIGFLVVAYAIANTLEAVLVAEFLRIEWGRNQPGTRRNRMAFVGVALVAPAISALAAEGLHELVSPVNFAYQSYVTWWFGDSIGLIAVGPALIGLVAFNDVWRHETWRRKSFVLPVMALVGTTALLFVPSFGFGFPGIMVTIWWALSFGFGPTSIAIAVFSSAVATSTALGISQFSGPWALPLTQVFVVTYALALMSTAALADAHKKDLARAIEGEKKLQKAVSHDPITGLLWRGDAVAKVRALDGTGQIAVAILDVDGMGRINDVLGRTIGDQLLEVLAQRFLMSKREEDVVARLGGDEFLFVARDIQNEDDVQDVMDQMLDGLMVPADLGSAGIRLSVCAGVTYGDLSKFEELMRDADQTLHEVKQRGRGLVHIRTTSEQQVFAEQKQLADRFAPACMNGEIFCVFQPVVPVTGSLSFGAEALVRWNNAERGSLSPAVFIPALERSGQMVLLGETVSALALEQLGIWLNEDQAPRWLSVNIHAAELRQGQLHERLLALCEQLRIPPWSLVLELTEHSTVNMDPSTRVQLDALRGAGVRIALDDFGTGYSSLAYLSRLPIDILKLDAAFLSTHAFEKDRRLIKAICTLASDIGLHTIVEGVETQDQLEAAIDAGADSVQGYWLGRPAPSTAFGVLRRPTTVLLDGEHSAAMRVSVSQG